MLKRDVRVLTSGNLIHCFQFSCITRAVYTHTNSMILSNGIKSDSNMLQGYLGTR